MLGEQFVAFAKQEDVFFKFNLPSCFDLGDYPCLTPVTEPHKSAGAIS